MSKRPDWLKVRIPSGENFFEVHNIPTNADWYVNLFASRDPAR